jgi:hypothetical protein
MPTVFISYVRENRTIVGKLAGDQQDYRLDVRTDFSIPAGMPWKGYLRDQIKNGDLFVACFSKQYSRKKTSYMNEELTIAIEQLRLRPSGAVWLIPVRLNRCEIPDRDIGAGETLRSLQWVDLFDDWKTGVERIAEAAGATRVSSNEDPYPTNLSAYAGRLRSLGLTPERLRRCIDISKYRNHRFDLPDIDEVVFRRAVPSELAIVPMDEFYEEWTHEVHLLEVVSFVNRGGMLLADVVPQNIREHPYDFCYDIVSRDNGVPIEQAMRSLSEVKVDATLPTIRQQLRRFVEIVAVVVFRWEFNGSELLNRRTLEVIELV